MGGELENNINDKSGINCLAGFAFQIKVFAYYSLLLQKQGDSVEFETIDDVNVKITDNNIDSKPKKLKQRHMIILILLLKN